MKRFEIEQKYRIKSPSAIRKRLKKIHAKKEFSGKETNFLYDSGNRLLNQAGILRLRTYGGGRAFLTFKGPKLKGRYKKRVEYETAVEWQPLREILKRIGFSQKAGYHKYREQYRAGKTHVTIDRLEGHGWFVEIEGSAKHIGKMEKQLGLSRVDREERSYLEMLDSRFKNQ